MHNQAVSNPKLRGLCHKAKRVMKVGGVFLSPDPESRDDVIKIDASDIFAVLKELQERRLQAGNF